MYTGGTRVRSKIFLKSYIPHLGSLSVGVFFLLLFCYVFVFSNNYIDPEQGPKTTRSRGRRFHKTMVRSTRLWLLQFPFMLLDFCCNLSYLQTELKAKRLK